MIIGLTGSYCAGKNYAASILEARGLPVLDVDKLGYKALDMEKKAILAQFGSDLQKNDGTLDRRLLGQRVFKDPIKLAALEAIVHPIANRLTDEWILAQRGHCVINAALLHRSSVFNKLDKIILIKAPFFTRLLRARRRDKLPWKEIIKRFASQKDFNTSYLSVNAKPLSAEIYIVENPESSKPGNLRLERQIDRILERIV